MRIASLVSLASLLTLSAQAAGSPQSATITALEGGVELLANPSPRMNGGADGKARALFEGSYYEFKDARVGDRVENGTFVRVRPGGKAQLIFDNGDAMQLGSGSLFRPRWSKDSEQAKEAEPKVDLPYGSLHSRISKAGPRSKLKITSKAMVLGVRGTEFSLQSGASGADQLSVIRGEVELRPAPPPAAASAPAKEPEAAPIAVKENQTARIDLPPPQKKDAPSVEAPKPVAVTRTTKEEIATIQKLAEPPKMPDEAAKPEAIRALEKKADTVAIQDIREYHPELANELMGSGPAPSAAELQNRVMERMKREAPSAGAFEAGRKAYEKQFQ